MNRFPPLRSIALAVLLAGGAARGRAETAMQDLNDFSNWTQGYNLVALGNASFLGTGDAQGGIAVENNLTVNSSWSSFASTTTPTNGDPSLFVGGQLTINGGEVRLLGGYASLKGATGWSWSAGSPTVITNGSNDLSSQSGVTKASQDPLTQGGPAGWSWSTETTNFDNLSTRLAAITTATTGVAIGTFTTNGGQTLTFDTSATSGVVVFDLTASELSSDTYDGDSFTGIDLSNIPSGVNYVINVSGLAANETLFNSINVNGDASDSQLLWNLEGSNPITINDGGAVYGSILAPQIAITDDTTINGQVVAASFTIPSTASDEMHDLTFDPAVVIIPEPATFALWALALCGAAVAGNLVVRRRNQARAALVPLASNVSK